jgi:uncharacterized protein
MTKRAVIIHGFEGSPNDCWIPSLGKALREQGFEVMIPKMPNPAKPRLDKWLATVKESIKKADKDTFFVGHSLGCITALQYISSLPEKSKVGGCVLVAGFIDSIGIQEIDEFTAKPLNLSKIKNTCPNVVMIVSDNDEEISLQMSEEMAEELAAQLIVEKGKGHFDDYGKVFELPSALKAIEEMSK